VMEQSSVLLLNRLSCIILLLSAFSLGVFDLAVPALLAAHVGSARAEGALGEAADGLRRRTGGDPCARRSPMGVSLTPAPCRCRHWQHHSERVRWPASVREGQGDLKGTSSWTQ
jgi:hypothetical protein